MYNLLSKRMIRYSILFISIFVSVNTYTAAQAAYATQKTSDLSPAIDQIAQQVLLNIEQNGWNAQAQTHTITTGGLYINWKMDAPTVTNFENTATAHDPLTDLTYLNALVQYQTLHPQDHAYDNDLRRIQVLVEYEFANFNVPKGFVYFYLLRDGQLLQDNALINEAYTAAQNFYLKWYDQSVGLIDNHTHTPVDFDVQHALTCAAALIDAGRRLHQPVWQQAGITAINQTFSGALNPQTQLLYNSMIVTLSGTQQVENYQLKASEQGSAAEALVDAYTLTGNPAYLDIAGTLLQHVLYSSLWDQANGGLFFGIDSSSNQLLNSYKETRAQAHVLIGLYRYNQALQASGQAPQFLEKQQQLIDVLSKHFYQATYHGYFYRLSPDYQIITNKYSGTEDYFTSEAMTDALDALQQSELPQITF